MIVVISHLEDPHAVRVLERLAAGANDAFLFDLAGFPASATLSVDYMDPAAPRARVAHATAGTVDLSRASAVWWRRPQFVGLDAISDPDARGFAHGEWHEALYGLWALLSCPWMNDPVRDEVASCKALQLAVASRLGFRIPDTLRPPTQRRRGRSSTATACGRRSTRSSRPRTGCGGRRGWYSRTTLPCSTSCTSPRGLPGVRSRRRGLRVTIVGDRIFPMAIDSRGTGYEVDVPVSSPVPPRRCGSCRATSSPHCTG